MGWEELLDPPWHLLDPEACRAPQREETDRQGVGVGPGPGRPRFEIGYYASFGCPVACTFCCSPQVSGLRWKAMPAGRMLDDLAALQERWGFDGVRFYDANFGVSERRVREFAEGVLSRGTRIDRFAHVQTDSILRWKPETLDLAVASGLYGCVVGGESGSAATLEGIGKPAREDGNLRAVTELDRRGIPALVTYMIGLPGEDETSIRATLEEARRITLACPLARPEVWPFRPIPGTSDFRRAVDSGWRPPATVEEWGLAGDYWNDEAWPGRIPPDVARERALFMHHSSLSQGRVRGRTGFWERRARAPVGRILP